MDRTGYARGTLATHAGLEAPVPALDPVEWLTMADMMGAMGGGMAGMSHGAASQSSGGMSHGGMTGMGHGKMAGMNHGSMQSMNHAGMSGMDHGAMSAAGASTQVRHARTEYGPSIDMRVDKIGRAHILTPVTNAPLVCSSLI